MVFTLHRYIFRELMKVFLLAAVALTLMMSLGSILRPVQEYGVGPRQVIHLMGYFLPITLTFVLPMAALFAAALVYGRFASDNELDACRASGVSLFTLVYPGLALAIMVAIANLILSFHVMPSFVQRAEKSLKADAKQIIFRNIQRKGYYKPSDGRYLIYADHADLQNSILSGVVITEIENLEINKIITAETAKIKFNPHKRFNDVQITAYNTYQMGSENEPGFSMERLSVTKEFASLMVDDVKFKKIDKIKDIVQNPMLFSPIEKLALNVYAQFTAELISQDINAKLTEGTNSFYVLHTGQKVVKFTADNCVVQDESKIEVSGNVTVIEHDTESKVPVRTLQCTKALLYIEGDELAPTLTMEIYNPTWRETGGAKGVAIGRTRIYGLILPKAVTDKFKTENILELVSPASTALSFKKKPSDKLVALQYNLLKKIQKTLTEIKAEMHSRLVFGIGCVPLIMIGIGLGIIKKGDHLLSAFGTSSLPAAILIVCIMMGKNIANNQNSQAGSGILLMWAGLVFMFMLVTLIYQKLLKN